jgi:hypothetical protein
MAKTIITEADRRLAEDFGTKPSTEAKLRTLKEEYDAAWRAFRAYVDDPNHDIRSREYKNLDAAFNRAQQRRDAYARKHA